MATSKSIPPSSGDAVIHSHALTVEQYQMVLEVAAGRLATLQRSISHAVSASGSERAHHLDVADILATYIGSMVDSAIGGDIIGDANYWNYGPMFDTAGKEVSHV